MKKNFTYCCSFFLMLLPALTLTAQNFSVTYDFAGANSSSGRTDPTPPPVFDGILFGSFSAVSSIANPNKLSANPNAGGRFSFTGWPKGAVSGSDVFSGVIDTSQYFEVTITPQTYYAVKVDSVIFTIQRSATGIRQYAVRTSADAFANNLPGFINNSNANLKVVAGNVFQITDAATTAQNGSKVDLTGLSDLASPLTLRFYGWNAESAGTFSIDNVQMFGTSELSATAPIINTSTSSITFPSTPVNNTSEAQSYTVQASNLTEALVITTTAPFTIASSLNGTYTNSLSISTADAANNTTIFVKFSPAAVNSYTGTIEHSSGAATAKTVSLIAEGIQAENLVFNFNTCTMGGTPGSGFTTYSVIGAQVWACSGYGLNSTSGVDVNGYSGGPQENEDWLTSPSLNIASINLPVLRFWSRGEFLGPPLTLLVSTDYDGSSDPNTATWTDLLANFPPLNNTWTLTDGFDLSAYKSFSKVYIAFKYTSSAELGAARWTVDDVDITNRTQLLSVSPVLLDFNDVASGTISPSKTFNIKAVGYGPVTLNAPASYQISTDGVNFSSSLVLPQATAEAGAVIFARFAPTVKALKIEGKVIFTASGLDSQKITLTGSSYPKIETFDAGCYNLSFFGSGPTNSATEEKISTQVNNIAIVLKNLDLDVVGIEEVSNDMALDSLISKLPKRKAVLSPRWSYSFNGPDPTFPPQKVGFIYDTTTMHLVETRVMFLSMYDSARLGHTEKLPNYPGGAISFWAGGRLPFMATFDAVINGVTKRIRMIDIHAKSSSDATSYSRRVYDAKVLLDTLDAYYKNDNIILVGDYNDRLYGATYSSATSPFKGFVDETNNYDPLTLPLDSAGKTSYISGSSMIDHVIISNELEQNYIANSTAIEDPRTYINAYNSNTASDHLPVYARFNFSTSLPITLVNFNAATAGIQVQLKWTTANEYNNAYFEVERSANNRNYISIIKQKGAGSSNHFNNYQGIDKSPLNGLNYYRLKQTDADGNFTYSKVVTINFSATNTKQLSVYPNPVTSYLHINLQSGSKIFTAKIADATGRLMLQAKGNIDQVNQQLNKMVYKLQAGIYNLVLLSNDEKHIVQFVKQ